MEPRPNFADAVIELRDVVIAELRIVEFLDWLAPRVPAWVDRLPTPPRWMGLMFWIYCAVGAKALALLWAVLSGRLV